MEVIDTGKIWKVTQLGTV